MKRFCPECDRLFDEHLRECPHDGTPLLPFDDQDDYVGTTIDGRYVVERKLGQGGMGLVYLARQKVIDRPVCVKLLRRELLTDPKIVKRFLVEAKAASALQSEHTITIHDFGATEKGVPYIAMEYLLGESLRDRLRHAKSLSVPEMGDLMLQVAASLEEAHEKGIVHRDMKPDNVFLTSRPGREVFVKVLDFGIARATQLYDTKMTKTGVIQGTPAYLSPEAIQAQSVDARTDIYALGIMMYEMLAGAVPFSAGTPMNVLMKHLRDEPEPIARINPAVQVPRAIHAFIWRCMAKDPADRPANARVFGEELRRALDAAEGSGSEPMAPMYTTSQGFRAGEEVLDFLTTKKVSQTPPRADAPQAPGPAGDPVGALHATPKSSGAEGPGPAPDAPSIGPETSAMLAEAALGPRRGLRAVAVAAVLVLAALTVGLFLAFGRGDPNAPDPVGALHATPSPESVPDKPNPEGAAPAKPNPEGDRVGAPLPSSVALAKEDAAPAPADPAPADPAIAATRPVGALHAMPTAAPAEVTVTIVTQPTGAALTLDGRDIGASPFMGRLPKGDTAVEVVASKAGYTDLRFTFTPDRDQVVQKALSRPAPKPLPARKPAATAKPAPKPTVDTSLLPTAPPSPAAQPKQPVKDVNLLP